MGDGERRRRHLTRQRVLDAGASDYVLKPQLFERLPRLLTRYVTGGEP